MTTIDDEINAIEQLTAEIMQTAVDNDADHTIAMLDKRQEMIVKLVDQYSKSHPTRVKALLATVNSKDDGIVKLLLQQKQEVANNLANITRMKEYTH